MSSMSSSVDQYAFEESLVSSVEVPKIEIVLISDNQELKKLFYFVLSTSSDVNYYTFNEINDDELALLCEMDIVIFNKNDEKLKETVKSLIQNNHLPITFFEITNQKHIRQRDILKAHNSGVDRLFKQNFQFEEFMIAIEMHLRTNFYTKRLLEIPSQKSILIKDRKKFEDRVTYLLENRVFFSLIKYNYKSDIEIDKYNLSKILREDDTILLDIESQKIEFLLLNITPNFAKELIHKRMRNFSISLEEIEAYSAFEIVYEH